MRTNLNPVGVSKKWSLYVSVLNEWNPTFRSPCCELPAARPGEARGELQGKDCLGFRRAHCAQSTMIGV